MILDLPRFLAGARPVWEELEKRLADAENDPEATWDLPSAERFYRLYQQTSAHLAEVRHLTAERELGLYLENLVARCYARIYVRDGAGRRFSFMRWFTVSFPGAVRRHARALAFSVLIVVAGSVFGAAAVRFDKSAKAAIMPFGHADQTPSQRVKKELEDRGQNLAGKQARFSGQLITNNTRVSFMALGLGMTFGIGTIIVLFFNGVILGAVALDYVADGQLVFLLGWILPHGSVEIPAILLGGQAGLVLGQAMIGWGNRTPRRLRLRAVMPDIMTIAGGVALMMVWAGIIEAFFSQYHEPVLPYAVKIAFGGIQLLALSAFLSRSGRE
ncbi:MAG: stage II sporulation protein M [Acidobacteria bacterium]|nr:stage II sporulation protein M [Acidobacteriota bacterium]